MNRRAESPPGRHKSARLLIPTVESLLLTTAFVVVAAAACGQSANPRAESPDSRQLRQAVSLAERGDPRGSMEIVQKLLALHPHLVGALKMKGMLLEQGGQNAEAAAVYEEALQLAPNDPDLLLKTGVEQLVAGHRQEAIRRLSHCVRVAPHDGDAQYYLAQAYHLDGQDAAALRSIRESARLEPDNAAVLQKYGELLSTAGNYQLALQWLLKAQHVDATLPRLDYDIGAADYKLMDIDGAARNLTRAVQIQPDDLNALGLLSSVQIRLADWEGARATFTRILALNPSDTDSLLGLGHCQLELKDYPAAIDTLHAVLRSDPTRLLAHFYLARAYAATGHDAEAQHENALHQLMMQEVTFVQSEATEAREGVIAPRARQLLAEHREADALLLYREHFRGTAATTADAYVFVGKLYLFLHDREDGLRCLHHALDLDASVRAAHTYEGILALTDGDLNHAESEFQAELANDPNYQLAIAEMGELRYRQQRFSEAARLLAQSKTMTPELLYLLCDSYFHLDDVLHANLTAEITAAYGRNNRDVMRDLVDLLNRNGQTELAQNIASSLNP